MRRLLVMVLSAFLAYAASAQVRWTAGGGIGAGSVYGSLADGDVLAWRIGGGAIVPLGGRWSLQPSLYFSQKGFGVDASYGSEQVSDATIRTRLYYLELPVYAAYRFRLSSEAGLSLKVGGYAAYGLGGSHKVSLDNSDFRQAAGGSPFSSPCDFGGIAYKDGDRMEYPKFRRFDAGLAYAAEFDYRHFVVGGTVMLGLVPMAGRSLSGHIPTDVMSIILFGSEKPHNITCFVTVGYVF